jgi:hypothetical protein
MLKHQKSPSPFTGRPRAEERGIPVTSSDSKERTMMEDGSQQLLSMLQRQHPRIINHLTRKNGRGTGQFSLPE